MSLITSPSLGAYLALALALVVGLLAAAAAVWLNQIDDEGDDWPGAPDQLGAAVADVSSPAVQPLGDHHA